MSSLSEEEAAVAVEAAAVVAAEAAGVVVVEAVVALGAARDAPASEAVLGALL